METNACKWPSAERIQIIKVNPPNRYGDYSFKCLSLEGENTTIARCDIILDDEARLIEELAGIFLQHKVPPRSPRYSVIVRALLKNRVPYVSLLKQLLKEKRNLFQLELNF
ncbi:hypothetical protein [Cohnella phaseoli]|uniref:Uncharacterized protein n=1 Tax=Cohnella phaseoli TaxID=456490 RepID=A0A3D9JPJ1_9BACL|nr:hypothetical protein [Cohnella phaseoli]RED75952.1 hypothetical protein DFP98_11312 [Cohnella phaseoli]